jgi:hypothetical protein
VLCVALRGVQIRKTEKIKAMSKKQLRHIKKMQVRGGPSLNRPTEVASC